MIELFAWMLEMGLYRMNQVPEKTYLALMELIGMRLSPAQAARVLLSFEPAEGKPITQWIPAGTQVATVQTDEADSMVFETTKPLLVASTKLVKCISTEQDRMSDNTEILQAEESLAAFPVFQSHNPVERFTYLGDPDLLCLQAANSVTVFFQSAFRGEELTPLLEWEYFNGHRWLALESAPEAFHAVRERNAVTFKGPLAGMAVASVAGREMPGSARVWLCAPGIHSRPKPIALKCRPACRNKACRLSSAIPTPRAWSTSLWI